MAKKNDPPSGKKKNDPPKDETPTEKMIRENQHLIGQPLMKEKKPKELTSRQKARRKMVDRANKRYYKNRGKKGHGGVLRQHD